MAAEPTPIDRASGDTLPLPRVLHAPLLVGGNPGQLALAEREIGLQSHCVSFARHPFGYPCDEVLWDSLDRVIVNELKRLRLLWRAVHEFDVIHFNFGTPILPRRADVAAQGRGRAGGVWRRAYEGYCSLVEFRDLALLKRCGKAIFVTYQGSDARQGSYCRSHFAVSAVDEVEAGYFSDESDARKRRDIAIFEGYADGIYALNPDLLHVLPPRARFLPYSHVDPREWRPAAPCGAFSRPRVVHAPSHRGVKGTRFVQDAALRLREEGIEFDMILVEGVHNEKVRRIYETADLVIDQLLLGWYGGLAVECMALGKPVIGYVREDDLRFVEADMRSQVPIIRAEPSTIYGVLKECLTTQRHRLPEIGARGRAYVERWHDPLTIARILEAEYASALRRKGRDFRRPPRPAAAPASRGRKHILVISFSDLARDARVNRQIRLLAGRFRVTAAGYADARVPGVEFVRLAHTPRSIAGKLFAATRLGLGLFEAHYWSSRNITDARRALDNETFDLVIANDLLTLPLACRLGSRRGVLFDAHEYSPRELEDRLYWRVLFRRFNNYLCRRYLSQTAGMLTVSEGIAEEYRASYGVKPRVLTNAPSYQALRPRGTPADSIRMIHHGGAIPSREIELMVEVADALDRRFRLDLMLVPVDPGYYERLRALVARRSRVRLVAPVPMGDLLARLNEYDIGLYLLPPNSFNNRYALPNKFFEFIQGRLAVAIGPSPEMARLVRRYDCGVVSEDFNPLSLARRLNALGRGEIDHYKQRSHEAARELCFEKNAPVLLDMAEQLLGGA